MRASRLGLSVAVALALTLYLAPPFVSTAGRGVSLSQHARDLLTAARERGETTITLLVAAQPARTDDVSTGLARLGANLRYQDATLGYLRVILPIDTAASVTGAAGRFPGPSRIRCRVCGR
jgi:hypothetical protein